MAKTPTVLQDYIKIVNDRPARTLEPRSISNNTVDYVALIVVAVVAFAYRTYVAMDVWRLFVTPLGVPPLTFAHAFGLLSLAALVIQLGNYRARDAYDAKKFPCEYRVKAQWTVIVSTAALHGAAYAASVFLT